LRVESPGGAVGPSQDLYEALVKAQEEYGKIVVASFGSVAASDEYYVACNADQIVSGAGSMTGSIGVYAKFPVAKELMDKIGFTYDTVKAGEYKDFGSMERGLSDKEREMMQGVIDDTYEQFIEAVMKGRKYPFAALMKKWDDAAEVKYPFSQDVVDVINKFQRELSEKDDSFSAVVSDTVLSASDDISDATTVEIDSIPDDEVLLAFTRVVSEGKVYTGRQALKVGLVDKLGSLEDAIKLAAEMSGISGEPTVIERKKRESSLLDYLSEGLSNITRNQTYSPLQYRFPY
jgi:signal peptide peptidase SppA